MNMELLPEPIPLQYNLSQDLDEKSEDTFAVEQEWLNSITSRDNKNIKRLFKEHHRRIKFLQIKFEDGDNSLHKAIQTGNTRLAKFLIILKMNVCICALYICKYNCIHATILHDIFTFKYILSVAL